MIYDFKSSPTPQLYVERLCSDFGEEARAPEKVSEDYLEQLK
jgi:hypothetical protein